MNVGSIEIFRMRTMEVFIGSEWTHVFGGRKFLMMAVALISGVADGENVVDSDDRDDCDGITSRVWRTRASRSRCDGR
jgi:hypothetical protein